MRIRRSELTTPGSDSGMMEKAAGSAADEVMLDLEDAVAPSEKIAARGKIVDALYDFDWSGKTVAVRINGVDHPNCHGDVIDVVGEAGDLIDVIIVPKVKRAEDVHFVATLLTQVEVGHDVDESLGIEVLIEETEAVQNVAEIAASSDRLEALIFGPGDYSASQGVPLERVEDHDDGAGYPGDVWHHVRGEIVIAARSNGLDAIDGPYSDFSNPEGYRIECERADVLGYVGKWAIHPSQIDIANETFAPPRSDVDHAMAVVEAMQSGDEAGRGAVQLDGEMVDEATARRARRTLDRAVATGMISESDLP